MAEKLFKGFKQVLEGQYTPEDGYLYFVRNEENSGKTDGYIYFNGKAYGTGLEIAEELLQYIGELPEGYSSVIDYFKEELSGITMDYATKEELDAEAEAREDAISSLLDEIERIIIASDEKYATKEELNTQVETLQNEIDKEREERETAIDTVLDTVEDILKDYATNDALSEATETLKEELSAETEELKTEINKEKEERQSADEGIIDIIAGVHDELDEKLNELDENSLKEIENGDKSVIVTEKENNKQSVSLRISNESNNAVQVKEDGVYAAIYYDGDDSE